MRFFRSFLLLSAPLYPQAYGQGEAYTPVLESHGSGSQVPSTRNSSLPASTDLPSPTQIEDVTSSAVYASRPADDSDSLEVYCLHSKCYTSTRLITRTFSWPTHWPSKYPEPPCHDPWCWWWKTVTKTIVKTETATEVVTEITTDIETETVTVPVTVTDEETLTLPQDTITLPPETITDVTTLPPETTTEVVTLPPVTSTITTTLPPDTVTVPGGVTTLPPRTITVTTTLPASTVTRVTTLPPRVSTIYQTVSHTKTIPGTDRTVTRTVDYISICPSRTLNPTFTPTAPVPSHYIWGCPPGTLCRPRHGPEDGNCNFEVGLPGADFFCSPEECGPPLPERPPQYWGEPVFGTQVEKYVVSPGYYYLDPRMFGLDFDVFVFDNTTSEYSEHGLHKRQGDIQLPSNCMDECSNVALPIQSGISRDELCLIGSDFLQFVSECRDCIDLFAEPGGGTFPDIQPQFAQFLNYCEQHPGESSVSPEPQLPSSTTRDTGSSTEPSTSAPTSSSSFPSSSPSSAPPSSPSSSSSFSSSPSSSSSSSSSPSSSSSYTPDSSSVSTRSSAPESSRPTSQSETTPEMSTTVPTEPPYPTTTPTQTTAMTSHPSDGIPIPPSTTPIEFPGVATAIQPLPWTSLMGSIAVMLFAFF
ncbi:hypothetical protein CPC735_000350 [Coccidioides posadasii C735 delta SOWgp]|uniref:Uncharacterized protein n=1 Tax=Coccidioides posadasii (strain C735) TaxID=222929 RepID=C5P002_COCP7|nr:hypothetical protein CPC735_000350 [Coccidioides posadasii C735 delta SOWgp]EER29779.1 hypothetical protein CPC735_000350 [Coccidioides posadasii C735 delta SOWgp]|eukprot:XP_003071924.1 hypothetical protein CPC735_000350 [Coccidioides posadasii C735 delta SOWgp]